jgi:uncharacterized protein
VIKNKPLSQNQRTAIIDILRGWALFSVVIMNYLIIFHWNQYSLKAEPDNLTSTIENISEIILGSKGCTLLAILFGYGFSVLLKNIIQSGQHKYIFFIRRMAWLFVFAFINTLFFGGDILNDYALMGLILLLFYNFNTKSLFIVGALILLLTPLLQSYWEKLHLLFTPKYRDTFYQLYKENTVLSHIKANLFMRYIWMLRLSYSIIFHLIQLGCFILGVALQRSNFFSQMSSSNKQKLKIVFWISLFFSVGIYFGELLIEQNQWAFDDYYNLYYPQILCIMFFTTTGIVWLYNSGKLKVFFRALQAIGKMTLTNYVMQNIISFILFICIKVNWGLPWYLLTGFIIYILQIFFSKWWLSRYNYGLLEWLWRCLSYEQLFKLKK